MYLIKLKIGMLDHMNNTFHEQYLWKTFENIADNTDMLRDDERITKLIKKVFEDEFLKKGAKLSKNN